MQSTRQEILEYLRRNGHATVKDLGAHLGLTATGIRQHLIVLERDGHIAASEERGRVGRPALTYRLTNAGDALFPKRYDELGNALIEEARLLLGPEALQRLMKNVAARFARPYLPMLEGRPVKERVGEAAHILADGADAAEHRSAGDDFLIEKHTCPFWNVATKNSAVCALDVEFVRLLTGTDARLSTSLLRGDNACTFRIRSRAPSGAAARR